MLGAALVGVACAFPMAGAAHSMAVVEAELEAGEPAAAVVDEPMPDLVFEDRDGLPVRISELRPGVVILSFDTRRARWSCVAADGPIASARALVAEATGLGEQLRFVALTERGGSEAGDPTGACAPSGRASAPSRALFAPRGTETPKSHYLETLGFDPDAVSGALVVDPSGRIRARFQGSDFAPTRLMMFAAALAHQRHAVPAGAEALETAAGSDRMPLRLVLGAGFALIGALGYHLYTRGRSPAQDRDTEPDE